MPERHVSIRLELDLAGEELSGEAASAAGGRRAFTGWMGLIASIDALSAAAPAGGNPAATSRQGPLANLAADTDRKDS